MLYVIKLSVVILNVMAPCQTLQIYVLPFIKINAHKCDFMQTWANQTLLFWGWNHPKPLSLTFEMTKFYENIKEKNSYKS